MRLTTVIIFLLCLAASSCKSKDDSSVATDESATSTVEQQNTVIDIRISEDKIPSGVTTSDTLQVEIENESTSEVLLSYGPSSSTDCNDRDAYSEASVSGGTLELDLSAIPQGEVKVCILPLGAGADNTPFEFTFTRDLIPSVAIASGGNIATNTSPIPITVVFTENITGFDQSDISVSGGTIGNFAGSGFSYSFELTVSVETTYTIDVAADSATDATGNGNLAAPQFSIKYDNTAPSILNVTSSVVNTTYKVGDVIDIQVQYDEPVFLSGTTGTVDLALETSDVNDGKAIYDSGSGTDTLTFNYTVHSDDETTDLDTHASGPQLTLGGDHTLLDVGGNAAPLTMAGTSLATNKEIALATIIYEYGGVIGNTGQQDLWDLSLVGSDIVISGSYQNSVDMNIFAGTDNFSSTHPRGRSTTITNGTSYGSTSELTPSPDDMSRLKKTVEDSSGNLYEYGDFESTLDLDPGGGTDNHVGNSTRDVFLRKFNSSGTYQWGVSFGGTGFENAKDMAVDSNGDVILVGGFENTVDFEYGAGTTNRTAVGNRDAYIVKYSSAGVFQWAVTFGGSGGDTGFTVTTHGTDIYVGGWFTDTIDFDPGAGTQNRSAVDQNDNYMLKLDGTGSFVWVKTMGGTGVEAVMASTLDSSNNIYFAGSFSGTNVDFGGGNRSSTGGQDSFFVMYEPDGTYVHDVVIGGSGDDQITDLEIDSAGNTLVFGKFNSTVDFDPGAGTVSRTSSGQGIFLLSLTPTNEYLWSRSFACNTFAHPDVFLPVGDFIYIGGSFECTTNFDLDPTNSTDNYISVDQRDVMFAKIRYK